MKIRLEKTGPNWYTATTKHGKIGADTPEEARALAALKKKRRKK